MTQKELQEANQYLGGKNPSEIIEWVLKKAKNPLVTTNFRPYEVALLHALTKESPKLPVIWCDTGYNTAQTYAHAEKWIELLQLQIQIYIPKQTRAYRDQQMGVPSPEESSHSLFSEQVKLEPFRRAMETHKPDWWFTNLRKGQTAFRDSIDILSLDKSGRVKVSPFYYWKDAELDQYIIDNDLENELEYYDPTKAIANRECGIHQ